MKIKVMETHEGTNSEKKTKLSPFFAKPKISNKKDWPLLSGELDTVENLNTFGQSRECGHFPLLRKLRDYLTSGFIHLNKPANVPTPKVLEWIQDILDIPDAETLVDETSSGSLVVCLGRAAIKLAGFLRKTEHEFVCSFKLNALTDEAEVKRVLCLLTGKVFQKEDSTAIGVKFVHRIELSEYSRDSGTLKVRCDAGTCVMTLCDHLGKILGVGGEMTSLQRVLPGVASDDRCTTCDVFYAMHVYEKDEDESLLRRVVQPLEALLVAYKRIVLYDWAVHAVCMGSWVPPHYVLSIESNIVVNEEIVIITTKGEAVAMGIALMTTAVAKFSDFGHVAKTELVIMEENTYTEVRYGAI